MASVVPVGSEGWQGQQIGSVRGGPRGQGISSSCGVTEVAGAAHWVDNGAEEVVASAVPVQLGQWQAGQ